ncbi:MAG: type II toxin-antitoxin system VapC family toxin [Candidatus Korobacteraceae bacterium]
MTLYYLETSALVKLYVREQGTERLLALASRIADNRLAIFALAQIELRSAIRRRERNGEIPPVIAAQLLELFGRQIESRFLTQPVTDFVLDIAAAVVDRYALRAYDAAQLAGYLALRNSSGGDVPVFVCSDQELLSAALQEGIPILDPTA